MLPGSGGGMQPSSLASLPALTPANGYYALTTPGGARPLCPATSDSRTARCFAWIRTDLRPNFTQIVPGSDAIPTGVGFGPAQIQAAYHLNPSLGAGQTVFIIDATAYKTAASDLATYRKAAGLPACTLASKCLQILNQDGKPKPLPTTPDLGWDGEQSLDLDAVSAACPKCKIVLIQTDTSSTLTNGVIAAITLKAKIVSMSFGSPEGGSANPGLPTAGVVFVASAGDNGGGPNAGGGPSMPCAYAAVVCVGGTALTGSGTSWHEVVWNDEKIDKCGTGFTQPCGATGSACSTIVPRPAWQTGIGCSKRAAADVSAVASPLTPLAVYNSAVCHGWCPIGGTSLSAPLIAGVFGLAGNASTRHAAMEIWKSHASLNDVTSGTNVYNPVTGPCSSSVAATCIAGRGYDGPTGWGTPKGSTNF
jgi:subtilase family serine protease